MDNEIQLRKNFEKYLKATSSEDVPLEELLWMFYVQGHLDPTPQGEDISTETVAKDLEADNFIEFIQSCLVNPSQEKFSNNCDYVEVAYPCTKEDKEKCIAWPDRCQEAGGDGETCGKVVLNLSKLCGVDKGDSIFIKDKKINCFENLSYSKK